MTTSGQQSLQLPLPHLRLWLDGDSVLIYCDSRGVLLSCGAGVLAALAARCDGQNWSMVVEELASEMGLSRSQAAQAAEQAQRLYDPRRPLLPTTSGLKTPGEAPRDLLIKAPSGRTQLCIELAEESARAPLQRLLAPLLVAADAGQAERCDRWHISRSEHGWTLGGDRLHPMSGLAMQQLGPVLIEHLKHWLLQHSDCCLLLRGDALAWQNRTWLLPAGNDARQRVLSAQMMQSGAIHLSQQLIGINARWQAMDFGLPLQVERSEWWRMPPERWLDNRGWRGLDGRDLRYYFVDRPRGCAAIDDTLLLSSHDGLSGLCEAGTVTEWCAELNPVPFQASLSNAGEAAAPMPLHELVPWLGSCTGLRLPSKRIDKVGQELAQWLGFDRDRRQILERAKQHLSLLN